MFRFRLYDRQGGELGDFTTAVPNWKPGEELLTGDSRRFRIVSIVWVEDEESPFVGLFEVEPVAEA